ncbi:S8 family serine peptidase [Thalassomonas actiniarum]|uniref:S8 family serine peptidase n=1 Tax=Thalassomonas actiniarum TaxID=485447 RepID=A0AAE9YRA6_9GAMM|nr:S8 family serine peptidase [Thalassomonas actiniarum]WDD98968.1 S8 family serine peptidase [Thalassomonas actiniarum]
MKKIQTNKRALSKLVIGVCAALGAQQTIAANGTLQSFEAANNNGKAFASWLASEKQAKRDAMSERIIVKYKDSANLRQIMFAGKSVAELNSISADSLHQAMATKLSKTTGAGLTHVKAMKNNVHVFAVDKAAKKQNIKAMLNSINSDKNVEYSEQDELRYLASQMQPWGIGNVQADQLSDSAAGNMTVCIIDSGYERSNPDLNANNHSGTNDSGTGNWYQNGGSHGTHVAGTIAAVNNSEGVVGVLPNTNVNLHIVKVFNESGWGYSSELVDAVDTCVNNGAKVVNMSLGGPSATTTERNGLEAATNAGVLLIAASGNDGDSSLSYPASYDTVMAVGAVDASGRHAEFSQYTAQVEVAGPGEAILSTVAGDGRLGSITIGGTTYANDMVVPQTRFTPSGSSYAVDNFNGSASGILGQCTVSGSSYSCSNVSGNICLAERNDNQIGSNYPEINPAKACTDAGATGVIVFSDNDRTALQSPFLVDAGSDITVPTVSVDRALGQTLQGMVGQSVSLSVVGNQDYAYYNGTSMATPHVAAVAALAWSNNISCTADEVRTALKNTALDLETAGRDDKTGYGLVQAKAASDYMASNCGSVVVEPPVTGTELTNGVAKTSLSGAKDETQVFTLEVPAGATGLSFNTTGGTGDADMYVKFGSAPTTSTGGFDCRSWNSNSTESCDIATAQAGTYYVMLNGYSAYSGVSLTGSFTETSSNPGGSMQETGVSASSGYAKFFTIEVPAGMTSLDITTTGGTGDADLYVRFGSQPTSSTYDCLSESGSNEETCSFTSPSAGTWHIAVNAYSTFSGVTLDAVWK